MFCPGVKGRVLVALALCWCRDVAFNDCNNSGSDHRSSGSLDSGDSDVNGHSNHNSVRSREL